MAGYLERLKSKKRQGEVLPKLPKGESTPTHGTAKTAQRPFDIKDSDPSRHISGIPSPEPPGMGPEYERIWNQAWTLAEWIDDPDGAPIEDRRAKLPELDDLRERMAAIERQGVPPAGENPKTSPPGTWIPRESTGATARDRSPDTCPAKCKRSGKCYAAAYFEGKPGRAKNCEADGCKHISNERGSHDSETVGSF